MKTKLTTESIDTRQTDNTLCIKAVLDVVVYLEQQTGIHVSYCPALDLFSQGDNPEHAKEMITEASTLFIEGCIEDDTLTEVLSDCGFKFKHPNAKPSQALRERTPLDSDYTEVLTARIVIHIPWMHYAD